MAIYSIKDLEKLTGIKAHTIRIWEQRYRLITPARTDTNIRYYTDENLRHLFNIALLNRQGVKISRIARMRPEEFEHRVSEIAQKQNESGNHVEALSLAMIDLDERAFEHIFDTHITERGMEHTMTELIYPFLDKINLLWLTGSVRPVHEKFVGNIIRRKLSCAIDRLSQDTPKDTSTFLLYLPENENQELTLLFVHYLLVCRRQRVIYLGTGTSLPDLHDAVVATRPDFVFTMLNEPPVRQPLQAYLDGLAQTAPKAQLLLTGAQLFMQAAKLPPHALLLNGLEATIHFLDEMRLNHRNGGIQR
ncbi:MAG: MerR family transcriptional regulator [Saprospiraceae bacterium]